VDFTATVEDEASYLHQTHAQWDKYEMYDYSLFRKSDGAYMGNLGVHNILWLAGSCELGYWILGEFEGEGYMTEAAELLTEAAFTVGFHRVEVRCSASNLRSAGVPRRLGFRYEARLREASSDRGRYEDTLVFGLLRGEWRQKPTSPRLGAFAVIFTSQRRAQDPQGYEEMAEEMLELAAEQPGYLGAESARGADGFGITVSYWETEEDIAAWKAHARHRQAQKLGQERWYESYSLLICRIEREHVRNLLTARAREADFEP
jgi:hypothetical protein